MKAKRILPFGNEAFSLLEVMMATAILAMGIMTLQSSWSGSIRAVQKSKGIQTASLLLKNKLTEFDVKYRDNISELPEEESGDFKAYKDYRWEMKSIKFTPPNFASLLQQQGGQDEILLDVMKRFTNVMEKHVKEMRVVVYYKIQDKELEYSATTLLVDYKTPLDLSGGL